jgi:hypothetical protein
MKSHRPILLFFTALCLSCGLSCDTDNNIDYPDEKYFIKYYGKDGNQSGVDIVLTDDGGYLLLGNSELIIGTAVTNRIYLVKANADGKVEWERFHGAARESAKDIEPTNDGNFVILSVVSDSVDNSNIKLIRIRPDGSKIDSVIYGTNKNDFAKSVTPLMDGGFIITGETPADTADFNPINPEDFSNIFHFRCNANLVFDNSWYELYGDTKEFDGGTKVLQVSPNQYYVFGYTSQDHPGNTGDKLNMFYYSIDGGGIPKNQAGYLGDFGQDTESAFVTSVPTELGGGYLILGTKMSATGLVTLHVSKLRSTLQFLADQDEQLDETISVDGRNLEAVSAASSVVAPGYLLLANEVRTLGTTNIWLTKIDQSGRQEWSVTLGSEDENDRAAAVKELGNGKILVLGTVGIGDNQSKMALFKLNSAGRLQE